MLRVVHVHRAGYLLTIGRRFKVDGDVTFEHLLVFDRDFIFLVELEEIHGGFRVNWSSLHVDLALRDPIILP